jgi:hypothetical protein
MIGSHEKRRCFEKWGCQLLKVHTIGPCWKSKIAREHSMSPIGENHTTTHKYFHLSL